MAPRRAVQGLLEFAVYGHDLATMERFYCDIFGLTLIRRVDGRVTALRCGNSTLLLFDPALSRIPGSVPEHGGDGAGHIAFVVPDEDLAAWRDHLRQHGIEIEREIAWDEGGRSIYVRDPAGNSVELAPPSIWNGLGRALLDSTGEPS
jgi:catechol 2,3-dioxygenase-like lactoylglutathione lyase family enzyme